MNVSIIIPVYNVAPYIEACLQSVIGQTYTGSMECLIVDDCGKDESILIAERMIAAYEGSIRLKILHHDHNRGLSAARNTGTLQATGDYLYYLDSDDEITEDCIEKLMRKVSEFPDVEMVQGNACRHYIQKEPSTLVKTVTIPYAETNEEVRDCRYKLGQIYVNVWNKLLKRDLIINNNILCKEDLLFEDNLWTFYLVKYLKNVAFVQDVTYHQKKRPHSITMGIDAETKAVNYGRIYREIINDLTDGYEQEEFSYFAGVVCNAYFGYVRVAPQFDEVFVSYWEKRKIYGSGMSRVKLELIALLRQFNCGCTIWRFLCWTKGVLRNVVVRIRGL